MSFILVPRHGDDLQTNAWNWRPTLELLLKEGLITDELYERMGAQGAGGQVDAGLAGRIAEVIERKIEAMEPSERMRADLTVTARPKTKLVITPEGRSNDVDVDDIYSANYEWLAEFAVFCRCSGGFEVF